MEYKVWNMGGLKDDIKEELVAVCFNEKVAKMIADAGVDEGLRLAVFDEKDNLIYPLL